MAGYPGLVARVAGAYARGGCGVELSYTYVAGYEDVLVVRGCGVEERVEGLGPEEAARLLEEILDRLASVVNERVAGLVEEAGFEVTSVEPCKDSGCYDVIVDVGYGVEVALAWVYEYRRDSGLGFHTVYARLPPVEDAARQVEEQLRELRELRRLVEKWPRAAIAFAVDELRPDAVVKAFKSGNSTVVTVPFKPGDRLWRYDVGRWLVVLAAEDA